MLEQVAETVELRNARPCRFSSAYSRGLDRHILFTGRFFLKCFRVVFDLHSKLRLLGYVEVPAVLRGPAGVYGANDSPAG